MATILRRGSTGEQVSRLQLLLNRRARLDGPELVADGVFGPATETAVRRFQQVRGLQVDGVVGDRTWAALDPDALAAPPYRALSVAMQVPGAPWIAVAMREVGQTEVPGRRANPRIVAYHATTTLAAGSDETPWCSSFVNWCLREAGYPGTDSAAAASWILWGQPTSARPGAILVIHNRDARHSSLTASGNHVAFLLREEAGRWALLGGNQGDQVRIASFDKTRWALRACRWPSAPRRVVAGTNR